MITSCWVHPGSPCCPLTLLPPLHFLSSWNNDTCVCKTNTEVNHLLTPNFSSPLVVGLGEDARQKILVLQIIFNSMKETVHLYSIPHPQYSFHHFLHLLYSFHPSLYRDPSFQACFDRQVLSTCRSKQAWLRTCRSKQAWKEGSLKKFLRKEPFWKKNQMEGESLTPWHGD